VQLLTQSSVDKDAPVPCEDRRDSRVGIETRPSMYYCTLLLSAWVTQAAAVGRLVLALSAASGAHHMEPTADGSAPDRGGMHQILGYINVCH